MLCRHGPRQHRRGGVAEASLNVGDMSTRRGGCPPAVDDSHVCVQHDESHCRQSAGREAAMQRKDTRITTLRLVVLTAAVTEIARVLPARDAASVASALVARLGPLLGELELSDHADQSLACDLVPLMSALQRGHSSTGV